MYTIVVPRAFSSTKKLFVQNTEKKEEIRPVEPHIHSTSFVFGECKFLCISCNLRCKSTFYRVVFQYIISWTKFPKMIRVNIWSFQNYSSPVEKRSEKWIFCFRSKSERIKSICLEIKIPCSKDEDSKKNRTFQFAWDERIISIISIVC